MNGHKRKQTKKKNKIAALPLVAVDFNGELKSSVEEDIKFYGILPLGELTRDKNLFKPGSPVSDKKIRIIPVGTPNQQTLRGAGVFMTYIKSFSVNLRILFRVKDSAMYISSVFFVLATRKRAILTCSSG